MLRHFSALFAALLGLAGLSQPAFAAECLLGSPGTTQRIAVGATGRSMEVHVPAGAIRMRDLPIVFLLHGSGGTGAAMLKSSGLAATSDKHGFLLAAPDAGIPVERGFVWNIPGVPTITGAIPAEGDADDVAFIGETIDWLARMGCIDRERVYATGLSGGGRMTSWLGCVAADRFAAIAPVVGLRAGNPLAANPSKPDPVTCRPSRPVPVLAFAGETDTTNPVAGGGAGYWQYSMLAGMTRWAELNGCRQGPIARALSATRWEYGWTQCRGGADTTAHLVTDAGHVWAADNDSLWDFFRRHRR
ncbi:MAG: alpha/beta hydrolase family esterase [Tsuneonella sp.]